MCLCLQVTKHACKMKVMKKQAIKTRSIICKVPFSFELNGTFFAAGAYSCSLPSVGVRFEGDVSAALIDLVAMY